MKKSDNFADKHRGWVDIVSEWVNEIRGDIKIIVGGGFASVFPYEAISKKYIDYAVIGEGEYTLVHILNEIFEIKDPEFKKKFPYNGYARKKISNSDIPVQCIEIVDKISFLKDLDTIPPPDWDIDGYTEYFNNHPRSRIPFMASRGCPLHCSFCNTDLQWGDRVRKRSVDSVLLELKKSIEKNGLASFHCIDDNILFHKKWAIELFTKISDNLSDIDIMFSNLDVRFLSDDVLDSLKLLGVENIAIATESGSKETQRKISKYLRLDRVEEAVERIHAKGFTIHNAFIIGFPGETLDQINETIAFAKKLKTESIQIHSLEPYRGTKAYDDALSLGVLDNVNTTDYESLQWHTGKIKSKEWDSKMIEGLAYDTGIELNFLATPLWNTKKGLLLLHKKMKRLTEVLPGHAIVYINMGYLSFLLEDGRDTSHYYSLAKKIVTSPIRTFNKYLLLDYPMLKDFNKWLVKTNGQHEY